jgi:glycosyltransferase involved in cell wall biosynthesis
MSKKSSHPSRTIVMVYQTDPFRDSGGGGITYLQNLVSGMSEFDDPILFLGAGHEKETRGQVTFVPVCPPQRSFPVFMFRLFFYCLTNRFTGNTIVHVHRLYFALPFLWFARKTKVVCSLHGWTFWLFRKRFGALAHKILEPLVRAMESYVLRRVAFFVPVSEDTLRFMETHHRCTLSDMKERVEIIPSMIDLFQFSPKHSDFLQKCYGSERDYVIFIGRLSAEKNVGLLLEAWKLVQLEGSNKDDTALVLVGHGDFENDLRADVKRLGLSESVIFHGLEEKENIPKIMNASIGLVLNSVFEASPTVVKESLACGVPVVTTDVGDVKTMINKDVNGRIVASEPEALAEGIRWLIEVRAEKTSVLAASQSQLERHSVADVCSRYHEIYERLIP